MAAALDWARDGGPHGDASATLGVLHRGGEAMSAGRRSRGRSWWPLALLALAAVAGHGRGQDAKPELPDTTWRDWLAARGQNRTRLARVEGGGGDTERAVDRALRWLARHQEADGRWSCDKFSARCTGKKCDGPGIEPEWDVGITGLAVLAFAGAGERPGSAKHGAVVQRALDWLLSVQRPDGALGPETKDGHWVYGHHIATQALAELLAAGGPDADWRGKLEAAVKLTLQAQNPTRGWRYGVRPGDSDTSITAWAFMSLLAARHAGIEVPDEAFQGALNWFRIVTWTGDGLAKTGYTQKGDNGARMPQAQHYKPTEAMTSAALACRLLHGEPPAGEAAVAGLRLLDNMPPVWAPNEVTDLYYWYYGALAAFQAGGPLWDTWSEALQGALLKHQRTGGHVEGSWDPLSAWGCVAGRVYTTAMGALCLETYYRYPRLEPK